MSNTGFIKNAELKHLEHLRERKQFTDAIKYASKLTTRAIMEGDYVGCAQVLGHHALTFEHLYERTHQRRYLDNMLEVIRDGFSLPIPNSEKAILSLRMGKVYLFKADYGKAEESMRLAYELVPKNGLQQWEFYGHYSEAIGLNGNLDEAFRRLRKALINIARIEVDEEWRKKIVCAGLYCRLIIPAFKQKKYFIATNALIMGLYYAIYLKVVKGYGLMWDKAKSFNYN